MHTNTDTIKTIALLLIAAAVVATVIVFVTIPLAATVGLLAALGPSTLALVMGSIVLVPVATALKG